MAGLYIHIPFCKQACHYCDFHFSTNLQLMAVMMDSIIEELKLRKEYLKGETVDTIYFGGGTPSLVPAEYLEKILDQISALFPGRKQEVTLEANPDDLNSQALATWKSLGIDRLSLGIQSFQDQILKEFNEEISKHPDKRIQKIFSMRYSGNKKLTPWRKISKSMNLSIQGCINIHNAALNSISKNIRSKYEIISQRTN